MRLHELRPAPGSKRPKKRVGRGPGSGRGKTAGRGQKGQKARSSGKGPFFEGGQTPFIRRVPKLPGFKNPFRKRFTILNLKDLNRFKEGEVVSQEKLFQKKKIKKNYPLKILGQGELEKKLTVKAQAFSKKASQEIEKAGGKAEVITSVKSGKSKVKSPASAKATAGKGKLKVESRGVKNV